MKNLQFKYMSAKNFMPFGPEGIEIFFDRYKNIVLIRGQNKDAFFQKQEFENSEEIKTSSNGTGKSSLQEILVFGLYGQTVKPLGKNNLKDVVHNKEKKDCKIEVVFNDYKILRTRVENGNKNKHSLRLWQSSENIWDDSTEITQGTMAATQKRIDEAIGLSYDAFINICIFTDDQRSCFLECDKSQKMEIVENLLSLAEYREWYDNAKSLRKEIKVDLDIKTKEYQIFLSNEKDCEKRLKLTNSKKEEWVDQKKLEYAGLLQKIKNTKDNLQKTDDGAAELAYQKAQQDIVEINLELPSVEIDKKSKEEELSKLKNQETEKKELALELKNSFDLLKNEILILNQQKEYKEQEIKNLESFKHGSTCGKCKSLIDEKNIKSYIEEVEKEISKVLSEIEPKNQRLKEIQEKIKDLIVEQKNIKALVSETSNFVDELDQKVKNLQKKLVDCSQVKQPQLNDSEIVAKQILEELVKRAKEKKLEIEGESPFEKILENDEINLEKIKTDISQKAQEIENLEDEIKYYDYWIVGFGENGIRKWIVDGIIPELNNRINYWLQFLVDNKLCVKFDNQLSETIERNPPSGDPYVYNAMSAGQKRRINLAISQSFAHIMALSSGSIPSLVFLDEVSTNIDFLGVHGIYSMICELAEDKQVFITTHDAELLRLLDGCDLINLTHENGYTKLV